MEVPSGQRARLERGRKGWGASAGPRGRLAPLAGWQAAVTFLGTFLSSWPRSARLGLVPPDRARVRGRSRDPDLSLASDPPGDLRRLVYPGRQVRGSPGP
jgi:hypothetical protein